MSTIPPEFESPFLRARPVKRGRHPAPIRPSAPLDAASLIPWREFVRAVYTLPPGWEYHGNLPDGISDAQFHTRIYRASRTTTRAERNNPRTDAKVRVVTRGDRFWVWAEKVPSEDGDEKPPTKAKRGWIGELLLKLRGGEPVMLDRFLTKKERRQVRERAGARGWRLVILKVKNGTGTHVQWVGEK